MTVFICDTPLAEADEDAQEQPIQYYYVIIDLWCLQYVAAGAKRTRGKQKVIKYNMALSRVSFSTFCHPSRCKQGEEKRPNQAQQVMRNEARRIIKEKTVLISLDDIFEHKNALPPSLFVYRPRCIAAASDKHVPCSSRCSH
jgi:hypothetical protein